MKNQNKGFVVPLIAFFITLIVVGGVYFLIKKSNVIKIENNSTIPNPISDRKTYKDSNTSTSTSKEQKLISAGREVLEALKNKDYQKLEDLSSSDGLSWNEYPDSLDLTKSDITKSQISEIPNNKNVYLFGYTDGKGDPINLTISDYINKWIYNADYINAPKVLVNQLARDSNNTPNNIMKYSAGRDFVAFHFNGFNSKFAGMDWTTLYLIFDNQNGEYKLRGMVKANWTI